MRSTLPKARLSDVQDDGATCTGTSAPVVSTQAPEKTAREVLFARYEAACAATAAAEKVEAEVDAELKEFDARAAGIAQGDVVTDRYGKTFQVCHIEVWQMGTGPICSVYGNPRLKDGSFGKQRRYIGTQWKIVGSRTTQVEA